MQSSCREWSCSFPPCPELRPGRSPSVRGGVRSVRSSRRRDGSGHIDSPLVQSRAADVVNCLCVAAREPVRFACCCTPSVKGLGDSARSIREPHKLRPSDQCPPSRLDMTAIILKKVPPWHLLTCCIHVRYSLSMGGRPGPTIRFSPGCMASVRPRLRSEIPGDREIKMFGQRPNRLK